MKLRNSTLREKYKLRKDKMVTAKSTKKGKMVWFGLNLLVIDFDTKPTLQCMTDSLII